MLGFNSKVYNNLLWNENKGYIVYTIQNMLIFESLEC